MNINWNASRQDMTLISAIVDRIFALSQPSLDRLHVTMDIVACHLNGCPLDLEALAEADDSNLCHDVYGIMRHINRETGKLEHCFLPRFAQKEALA